MRRSWRCARAGKSERVWRGVKGEGLEGGRRRWVKVENLDHGLTCLLCFQWKYWEILGYSILTHTQMRNWGYTLYGFSMAHLIADLL